MNSSVSIIRLLFTIWAFPEKSTMKANEVRRKYMGTLRNFRKKKFKTDIDLCQEEEKEIVHRLRKKKTDRSQTEILKNVTDFILQGPVQDATSKSTHLVKKRSGITGNKVVVLNPEQDESDEELALEIQKSLGGKNREGKRKHVSKAKKTQISNEHKMEKKGISKKMISVVEKKEKIGSKRAVSESVPKQKSFELEIVTEEKSGKNTQKLLDFNTVEDSKKPTLLQQIIEHVSKRNFVVKTNYYFDCRVTSLNPLKVTENYLNQILVLETDELLKQIQKENYNIHVLNLKIIFKNFEIIVYNNSNCRDNSKGFMIKLLDPHVYSIMYESSIKINFQIPFVEEHESLSKIYKRQYGYSLAHNFESAMKASKLSSSLSSIEKQNLFLIKSGLKEDISSFSKPEICRQNSKDEKIKEMKHREVEEKKLKENAKNIMIESPKNIKIRENAIEEEEFPEKPSKPVEKQMKIFNSFSKKVDRVESNKKKVKDSHQKIILIDETVENPSKKIKESKLISKNKSEPIDLEVTPPSKPLKKSSKVPLFQ